MDDVKFDVNDFCLLRKDDYFTFDQLKRIHENQELYEATVQEINMFHRSLPYQIKAYQILLWKFDIYIHPSRRALTKYRSNYFAALVKEINDLYGI